MKQLFVSFDSFFMFLVCSQTQLHSFCFICFICFGGPMKMNSESFCRRFSFRSTDGDLRYFMVFPLCSYLSLVRRSADRTIGALAVLGHKVRSKDAAPRNAPSSHTCFEFIFSTFSRSFRSTFHPTWTSKFFLCLQYLVKC